MQTFPKNYYKKQFLFFLTVAMTVSLGVFTSACNKTGKPASPSNFNNNPINSINKSKSLKQDPQEDIVTISVIPKGRLNPFRSYQERNLALKNDPLLDKIPKPPSLSNDPSLESLLSIQVSGILYDKKKPSALVKVNDQEYLVHKGDNVFEYKINNITAEKVEIINGYNSYKAGIGEIIEEGEIFINPVNKRITSNNYVSRQEKNRTSNIQGRLPSRALLMKELPKVLPEDDEIINISIN